MIRTRVTKRASLGHLPPQPILPTAQAPVDAADTDNGRQGSTSLLRPKLWAKSDPSAKETVQVAQLELWLVLQVCSMLLFVSASGLAWQSFTVTPFLTLIPDQASSDTLHRWRVPSWPDPRMQHVTLVADPMAQCRVKTTVSFRAAAVVQTDSPHGFTTGQMTTSSLQRFRRFIAAAT